MYHIGREAVTAVGQLQGRDRKAVVDQVNFIPHWRKGNWLIVSFGAPGLGRTLQSTAISPAAETEWCSPSDNRGPSAPHANRYHGRREHVVSSSRSPVSRGS